MSAHLEHTDVSWGHGRIVLCGEGPQEAAEGCALQFPVNPAVEAGCGAGQRAALCPCGLRGGPPGGRQSTRQPCLRALPVLAAADPVGQHFWDTCPIPQAVTGAITHPRWSTSTACLPTHTRCAQNELSWVPRRGECGRHCECASCLSFQCRNPVSEEKR